MKKKIIIAIFAAIVTVSNLSCMEQEDQNKEIIHNDSIENLHTALQRDLITVNGIEKTRVPRKMQYEMLTTFIQNDNITRLELCLRYKFNPNRYHKKPSSLHCAIECNNPEAIKTISRYDPDLTSFNNHKSPLHSAINSKHQPCIDAMIDIITTKIDQLLTHQKSCSDKHMLSPYFYMECMDLIWQLKWHRQKEDYLYEALKTFLENSIVTTNNIEYSSISPLVQYEALKICIEKNDIEFLSLYLLHKFNPNRYHNQLSLLHYAVQRNNPKAIEILSLYNPDLITLNEQGKTPLDYAKQLKHKQCIRAMRNAIKNKINELVTDKNKHCGLTKHILTPGFCEICVESLKWQLIHEGVNQPKFTLENGSLYTEYYLCTAIDPSSTNSSYDS